MTKADVLLVTVSDVETEELEQVLNRAGYRHQYLFGSINTYAVYGLIGGAVVAHVRSTMGSGGQGGSTLTVVDAIRELKPRSVIATGIAFGMNASTQPIGQLLLSQRLSAYELQRVGTNASGDIEITQRGPSSECSSRLLSRFRDARLREAGISVLTGEVLSGDKLIDNAEFKTALLRRFPEAVGGEMEGAGVQAASGRDGVDWIVAKCVCDYACQKSEDKENRQRLAAQKSAAAVLKVLEMGGLADRS